jgi:hypothetical protein
VHTAGPKGRDFHWRLITLKGPYACRVPDGLGNWRVVWAGCIGAAEANLYAWRRYAL